MLHSFLTTENYSKISFLIQMQTVVMNGIIDWMNDANDQEAKD